MSNYEKVKLEFGESINLSENGCIDELYFQQFYGNNSVETDGSISQRSLSNMQD